jgi:hypothetical protein
LSAHILASWLVRPSSLIISSLSSQLDLLNQTTFSCSPRATPCAPLMRNPHSPTPAHHGLI